jgi:hypothetical protein
MYLARLLVFSYFSSVSRPKHVKDLRKFSYLKKKQELKKLQKRSKNKENQLRAHRATMGCIVSRLNGIKLKKI